jgi:hypothetical protein
LPFKCNLQRYIVMFCALSQEILDFYESEVAIAADGVGLCRLNQVDS